MKRIVAVGLTVLSILVLVVAWRGHRASATSASESQIFIHGTPVCVSRQGESIAARVGECGAQAAPWDGAPAGRLPGFDGREGDLPPGHPPVGPDMIPGEGTRRILI